MLRLLHVFFLVAFSTWISVSKADVFVVDQTTGGVNVSGTLYWAVAQANARPGFDNIVFNLTAANRYVWLDAGPLQVADQVDINGETVDGSLVTLMGDSDTPYLFRLSGGEVNTIWNFVMEGFTEAAITIDPSSSQNYIYYNWIYCPSTQANGVNIHSSYNSVTFNQIGGCSRAIEVGEDYLTSPADVDLTAVGNYIFYNQLGDVVHPNPWGDNFWYIPYNDIGILIAAGASQNWISHNYIEFSIVGIKLAHPTASSNAIMKNRISNNFVGILLTNGASFNAVGSQYGGNYIHGGYGVNIIIGLDNPEQGTTGAAGRTWVQSNVIGGSETSTVNQYSDGYLFTSSVGISVAGGSDAIEIRGNQIIINQLHGVQVYNSGSVSVLENWIGMNSDGVGGSWEDGAGNGGYGVVAVNSGPIYISGNARGDNAMGFLYQAGSTVIEQSSGL
ncbi:MAG: hypothetical protein ACK2UO_09295 [Caldilineaceae bacterium]